VTVPPLRERREDILLLAEPWLAAGGRRLRLTAHAAEALLLHDWPYNVRELEQVIAVAAVRAGSGGVVRLEHLPPAIAAPLARRAPASTPPAPLAALVDPSAPPSREALARVLAEYDGRIADVARYFGKDRKQVYRWIERLGV